MNPAYLTPFANHLWQSTVFAGAAGMLTLALRKNPAKGIDVRKISTVEQLMKLKGKRFDHQFVQAEIRDHEKAIADFKRESQHGQDPDVKAYASKMIPILEGHLRQAKALAKPVEPRSRAKRRSNTVSA
jgi:predicted outer membrane protein